MGVRLFINSYLSRISLNLPHSSGKFNQRIYKNGIANAALENEKGNGEKDPTLRIGYFAFAISNISNYLLDGLV
jgi:hypothetical protein